VPTQLSYPAASYPALSRVNPPAAAATSDASVSLFKPWLSRVAVQIHQPWAKPVLDNLATGCQLTIQKFDAQQLLIKPSAIKTASRFQKLGLLPGLFEAVRYS